MSKRSLVIEWSSRRWNGGDAPLMYWYRPGVAEGVHAEAADELLTH